MSRFYIYDLETLKNFFSFTGKFEGDDEIHVFEISPRKNQRDQLIAHLNYLKTQDILMTGINILGFDYPIIHELMKNPHTFDETKAWQMCKTIIEGQNYGNSGNFGVRVNDRYIPQVCLSKINHFDNANKRVSLKSLQVAMRSESVEDLPVPLDVDLTEEQMNETLTYNLHDVTETEKFLSHCKPLIEMRQDLLNNGTLRGDVLNYSDVKIGVEYLINKIGRHKCFTKGKPHQSTRHSVIMNNIILPKIQFRQDNYDEVLQWFKGLTVYMTDSVRPKFNKMLSGLDFHFGVGGVHASADNKVFRTTDTHIIKDVDVSGMYPAVAISNGFGPEHLGKDFLAAYEQLSRDRRQYPKGTTMNAVLKLANNGVYGNSNNSYSCFYDPKYMFSVTVNGQLQLLQLAESLSLIPGLELIQANTDGITVRMPRKQEHLFDMWCRAWEKETKLNLEEVEYEAMWIADVNNYIAKTTDGKIKRKGRYWYPEVWKDYEGWWNKNFSNMTAQKGAELCMTYGYKPEEVIRLFSNPFDFMLCYKTPKGATVYVGDKPQQKTVRYYVSKSGGRMKKVAKPKGEIGQFKIRPKPKQYGKQEWENLKVKIMAEIGKDIWDERVHTKKKNKYTIVDTSIQSGYLVNECNIASEFNWNDVDYDYYVDEIKKLIIGGKDVQ